MECQPRQFSLHLARNFHMKLDFLWSKQIQPHDLIQVLTEFKNGNFAVRLPTYYKGEQNQIALLFNEIMGMVQETIAEFARIGNAVGKEGKIEARIHLPQLKGGWQDKIAVVNTLITDLTHPMQEMSRVIGSIASGDLTQNMPLAVNGRDLQGAFHETAKTVNTMVVQLSSFASEVTRVAREVGTEGKLGGQADVKGLAGAGTWKELTENVNMMASNLTSQVRNIAEVTTAVANGDLTRKITVNVKGEILQLKNTINTMVDQLSSFASEVTRVAREVGTEGKLDGQAKVNGVGGIWKDLTDNVNHMANNLTTQVRNIADVTTAVANGDLTRKITVNVNGEILHLKNTINTMVDQLSSFASEVTRVAREVGTEGKLGGQANVKGVAGTWRDLTENVNMLASNLANQVRNIAEVTTAVAMGDLSKKITVDVAGEFLQLKLTINTMVGQLRAFASEVTRVAREVGTEGKLGGQADVKGVAGTWKDLTENVNMMASNLTSQVRNIAEVTTAVAKGDLTRKITVDVKGEILELKDTINTMVDQLSSFASEVTRVAREVGIEGKLGGQAYVGGVAGTWKDLTDNVNRMAGNLTSQVRNIAGVTKAVANGDLSKKITVDAKGEIFELKNTINIMVDQLSSFAAEVTRVAREVGTEGKLGGQAVVEGVGGIWKDFTDNVNQMAFNLTEQVRSIAKVVTAVAQGNLKKKLIVQAKGEVAALSETINSMIDTLATFADQVTGVAREVGVEGRLGGQASVPGASGTWKDLTDNVNQLAANLTNQVRAISKVARAVTTGDLTRTIQVEAQGEVAALKDIINEMIFNLKETTLKNSEQDWLKTNIAKITRILQGQKDIELVARLILSELVPMVSSQHGIFYISETIDGEKVFRMLATYAYKARKRIANTFRVGEGLVGQCAYEKQRILLTNVPENYIQISSGLGEHKPLNIVVLPILFEGEVKAIIELGTFDHFTRTQLSLLDQLPEIVGIVLNSIETNSRTETLLIQSQSMATELGSQKEELKKTNEELEEKAKQLAAQNAEVAQKNQEVEIAKRALEEKAEQLALASKYKSEFLANMSHELRTPLNSLLLLSQHLAANSLGNLTTKQIEYANTISSSGNDLLNLINDILDLSKIESGVASLYIDKFDLKSIISDVERMFSHIAEDKALSFKLSIAKDVPEMIQTDATRLSQILKNFLSNAYKFTDKGGVALDIFLANSGWQQHHPVLSKATNVIAFRVSDTGLGIPIEKQQIIFEAFQQADGTTNRKYGGCGLGLSISREISVLLGGEITLQSEPGKGSIFTFYLSDTYANPLYLLRQETVQRETEKFDTDKSDANLVPFPQVIDDRFTIEPTDSVILLVEMHSRVETLLELLHENKFKLLIAGDSNEALNLIHQHTLTAIIIAMKGSPFEGNRLVKRLKGEIKTRHIPIHIVDGEDALRIHYLRSGVRTVTCKPLDKETIHSLLNDIKAFSNKAVKKLLLAVNEGNENNLSSLFDEKQIEICAAHDGKKALQVLETNHVDCVVLSSNFVDRNSNIVNELNKPKLATIPVVIFNNNESNTGNLNLKSVREDRVMMSVSSPELLLDAATRFLHREYKTVSEEYLILDKLHSSNQILFNKKILIVDDDVRNIFAVTSALEDYGITTMVAESGNEAIKMLTTLDHIDAILMDIMMPDMDGYEATQKIREQSRFKSLPIIAITAKAMKDDCGKCLMAGASDYIPKPIDTEILLATLRLWLR